MDQDTKQRIARQVSRSFPEMNGVRPSVRQQSGKNGLAHYLLIFKGKAQLPGGKTMSRIVRVLADESGNIIRMSTSR
jgi:hypothetical protein